MADLLENEVATLDTLLSAAVEKGDFPGVAAVAANRDGVVYRNAFGVASSDPLRDMAPDTVAWIASMTKTIVALGALQLVERGQLDLDAPMSDVLPQLAEQQVLDGFDDRGQPVTHTATIPVTLRHLLSHTAGNGYHFWHADVQRYQEVMGLPGIIECREATLTTPLLHEPGTAWVYGMNIDWVGKAIEKISGGTLEEYLRANILDPLGMTDTSFIIEAGSRARLSGMNVRTPEGDLVQVPFEMTQEPEFQMAGGAMYGSVDDYVTLLRMLLGNGTLDGVRILAAETVEEARRNQIGDLAIGPIHTVDPGSSNDVDFLPGQPKKWGLLGMINVDPAPNGRSAGSLFWAGLGNTYFWVDWDNGDCGALFTQILPFADHKVLDAFEAFERSVHRL